MKKLTKRLLLLFIANCMMGNYASAQDTYENDFGTWLELGAKKNLSQQWSMNVDAELRTADNSTTVDRISIGLSGTYKLNKYVKFSAGYTFLNGYKPDKTKQGKEEYDINGNLLVYRERFTPGHWTNRHRFYIDISPDIKLGRVWRISLRERYQYTFTPLQHHMRDTRWYELENGSYELDDAISVLDERQTDPSEHKHVLRSRIKLEYDKKHLDWTPFVSIEAHNNLRESMHMRQLRAIAGTEYKINSNHSVGAAYVFTRENEDGDKELFHALNISYNYKF